MPSGSPERLLAIQKVNATTIVEQDGEESEISALNIVTDTEMVTKREI